MNNSKTLATIAAIVIVATLVVGGTLAATTTPSAFAYPKKGTQDKEKHNEKGNGNTDTIQKCKQAATQSGFDNNLDQECQNVICTHPGENAACVTEVQVTPPPVKEVCTSVQPATVFDVTTTEGNTFPSGTVVCLGKPGENNPQNFPPGAAIIPPSGSPVTGATVRIDNSVNGGCPQGVTAIVDSGNPPGGFDIGDTACITFVNPS